MAEIDAFIGPMMQRGAQALVLESGQRTRLLLAGQVASANVLGDAELLAMLREAVPPELAPPLDAGAQLSFSYASPWGPVGVLVERRFPSTRATITPASGATDGLGASSPYRAPLAEPEPPPTPDWAQPFADQSPSSYSPAPVPDPNPPPIPSPFGGPPSSLVATPRPSVDWVPALALAVVCLAVMGALVFVVGEGANYVVVLLSSIAVLIDSHRIGARRGKLSGVADLDPWSWFFVCLLLWIVGLPYYLLARPLLLQIRERERAQDNPRNPYAT